MVSWGVAHEDEVVWRVLVVRRDVERHHLLEEPLGGLVEGEERVPLDVVEVALARVGQLGRGLGDVLGRVEAEELVEPFLNGVT